ncbi:phosphotransferase family protein [Nucisporomicrobium flavum]|uniref:phosphotransferase family protein n=1 Tax=Nucisporomicrobium flavum TaxID=2785915 RepID=UPI0018F45983|nr:phosphotransferase [Nucisporomicrobium flavum]
MRPVSLPEIAYGATAVRPDWDDLPPTVRSAINDRFGSPVVSAATAGGGFTRAFAAIVETAAGERAFLKAAPLADPPSDAYAREAAITSALPPEVPAARPRWTLVAGGHYVLCLEAVRGRVPELPWKPDDLASALQAWQRASTALAVSPVAALPRLSDIVRGELSWWSEIAAGRAPIPPSPAWVRSHLDDLARLEQGLPPLVEGPAMLHGDLRIDNIMIDAYGKSWLCDWTWPCLGAPWFDTVTLLVTVYASGLDTDRLLEPWGAPDAGVDGTLAAMSGYWLTRAAGGPSSASPHGRQHQRFSGGQALAWLAARRGWPTTG